MGSAFSCGMVSVRVKFNLLYLCSSEGEPMNTTASAIAKRTPAPANRSFGSLLRPLFPTIRSSCSAPQNIKRAISTTSRTTQPTGIPNTWSRVRRPR